MQVLTTHVRMGLAKLGLCALIAATPLTSSLAAVVNFDNVAAAAGGTLFPGNQFAAQGVTFTSGNIASTVDTAGEIFTLAGPDNQLLVIGNANSISEPNFAAAADVFGANNDLLMTFSTPVTSVQLTTDDAGGENADVVRLLALAPTGNPNEFVVLAVVEGLDDAIASPANLLGVSLATPFSFALFQVTTEAEGFDNLTFMPEPTSLALAALALLAVGAGRWRRITRS